MGHSSRGVGVAADLFMTYAQLLPPLCPPFTLNTCAHRGLDFIVDVGPRVATASSVVDFTGAEPVVVRHGLGDVSMVRGRWGGDGGGAPRGGVCVGEGAPGWLVSRVATERGSVHACQTCPPSQSARRPQHREPLQVKARMWHWDLQICLQLPCTQFE